MQRKNKDVKCANNMVEDAPALDCSRQLNDDGSQTKEFCVRLNSK